MPRKVPAWYDVVATIAQDIATVQTLQEALAGLNPLRELKAAGWKDGKPPEAEPQRQG
jgi:hypothetical protein